MRRCIVFGEVRLRVGYLVRVNGVEKRGGSRVGEILGGRDVFLKVGFLFRRIVY